MPTRTKEAWPHSTTRTNLENKMLSKEARHQWTHTVSKYQKNKQKLLWGVRVMVPLGAVGTGRGYKGASGRLQCFWNRCCFYGDVHFMKIHWAVHWWFVLFSVCLLYFKTYHKKWWATGSYLINREQSVLSSLSVFCYEPINGALCTNVCLALLCVRENIF